MDYSKNSDKIEMLEIFKTISKLKSFYDIKDIVLWALIQYTGYDYIFLSFFPEDVKEYMVVSSISNKNTTVLEKNIGYTDIPRPIIDAMLKLKPHRMHEMPVDFEKKSIFDEMNMDGKCMIADVLPIVVNRQAEGFILCCKKQDDKDESDFKLVASISGIMELFLENKRRNLRVESIIKRLKDAVQSMSRSIRQLYEHTAVEPFLVTACRLLCEITRSKSGLIIVDDVKTGLQSAVKYGQDLGLLGIFEEIKASSYYDGTAEGQYFNYATISQITRNAKVGSFIYYKLTKRDNVIGYIMAANSEEYLDEEINILGIFAHQIMVAMDISLTSKEIVKHKIVEKELEIVSEQQKLIMSGNNILLHGHGEISFLHKPSEYIGGDFCKIFTIDEKRVGVFITDVMGHGVLSNYFGAIIKGSLRTLIYLGKSASEILTEINRVLYEDFDKLNIFATARVAIFDGEKNSISSANAGHLYPIAIKEKGGVVQTEELDFEKGIPLGVLSDTDYDEYQYRLADYEMVAFYTDGITESVGMYGEPYGTQRLKKFLLDNYKLSSNEIYSKFEKEIYEFAGRKSLEDDYILLIYKKL